MKIIKPFRLTSLHRPYSWRQKNFLSVAIFALADMRDMQHPKLLSDIEVWREVMPELDCDGVIDHVLPKTLPEFLIGGYAYTHHQKDKTQVAVRAQVGELDKELLVFGDRYLIGDKPTAPAPFEQMPLTWSHAFGGPGYAENPAGTGIEPVDINGQRLVRYPNVEHGVHRYQHGQRSGKAYGFGPVNMLYPRRFGLMGSYSERWKKHEFPGFFSDMNPVIFNAAEPDQRWPQRAELPPGAPFRLWNMHPEFACWEGHLPTWKARAFIRAKAVGESETSFSEIAMRATTAWFVPHQERVLLIYHGNTEVSEDDASDVLCLMSALEEVGQERTLEHYETVMCTREDPEQGGLHVLRDDELITEAILGALNVDSEAVYQTPTWIKSQLLKHKMVAERRQEILDQGRDPDEFIPQIHGPERKYGPSDLPDLAKELADMKVQTAQLEQDLRHQSDELKAHYQRQGVAVPDTAQRPAGPPRVLLDLLDDPQHLGRMVDPDALGVDLQALATLTGETQPLDVDGDIKLPASHADFTKQKPDLKVATAWTREPAFQRQLRSMKPLLHQSYLYSAHWQDAALKLDTEQNRMVRDIVLQKYQADESLSELDLTGCALPGLNFIGADFSRSLMENSNLVDSEYRDCDFSACVLARADLSNTRFVNCRFDQANLSLAKLYNVCFENCSFKEAVLEDMDFEQCRIQGGRFEAVMPNKLRFLGCQVSGAIFSMSIFNEAVLTECRLEEVRFEKVSFQNGKLGATVWERACLDGSSFFITEMQQVFFQDCELGNCAFIHQTHLDNCAFEGSTLRQCNFRETSMQAVNFEHARIEQCDFSLADMRQATLRECLATDSMFIRSMLVQSDLSRSHLIGSDFKAADLRHANLSRSNLFRTNFALGRLDPSTVLTDSYQKEVNLYPLRQAGVLS